MHKYSPEVRELRLVKQIQLPMTTSHITEIMRVYT